MPRYRQRLAFVPLNQGRPVWVDDPHFNVAFHVRHTALPSPGGEEQLKRLTGRVFSQALDRNRPLWELWLVEGLSDDRFALLSKTHHALVDGVSGVDIFTVLMDTSADPMPVPEPERAWVARPLPSRAQLLADALVERATVPTEIVRGVRATLRGPRHMAGRVGTALAGVGAMARVGLQVAPSSPFNVPIGPHRRFTWVEGGLAEFKAVKNALGGTVNDVVLAAVAGALGSYLRMHGEPTDDLVLRAMVPVSIRAKVERGALGNKVAAMWAPLPVGLQDPVQRLLTISREMDGIKESGQAVGAQVLTELTGFAPPTIMAQAARPAGPPAPVQPRGDQRARPAVPALHARPPARGDVPDGPAGREPGPGHRDHELRRAAQLRAQRGLRRDRGSRGARRRVARGDRGARRRRRSEPEPGAAPGRPRRRVTRRPGRLAGR